MFVFFNKSDIIKKNLNIIYIKFIFIYIVILMEILKYLKK